MKFQLPVKVIYLYVTLFVSFYSNGQDTIKVVRKNYVESGVLVSSASETPFWLRANVLGVVPNTGTNFRARGGFY